MLLLFWGCPALRAGRAIAQLAVRSALRGLRPLGLPPSAALLQPLSLRAFGPVGWISRVKRDCLKFCFCPFLRLGPSP